MSTVERLVKTEDLKTSRLMSHRGHSTLYYDSESDDLLLLIVPTTVETIVHYLDEHVALLYEPDSLEVVGFQIEAFQHSFLGRQVRR